MKAIFRWFFYLIVFCSLLFILSFPDITRGEEIADIKVGDQAPNFTLEDLNGHTFKLSDYKGKPVILLFMTTWIRGTWKMIPHMKKNYSLYSSRGLVAFNIDVMEPVEKAERFAKGHDILYPTLLDKDGEVSRKFGIVGVPIVVLIDRDGKIICWDCSDLANLLEELFRVKK